ncbi:hypothetical protein [Oligella sp. HMSC09E12]|uniref:hypothetical protein n=1 Tax=Oligella sp. HMSC09E12 TaxID=1581147 RepID=UPI00114D0C2C|nr:hypothetical protein [Oligella sp. HMSC09E12]
MSKFQGKKTDNAPITAKRDIRHEALNDISDPCVLEVFCGAGEMYRDVWHKANDYLGIDKRKFFDERKTICGDADKAIRLVDLNAYNIIDIDAYGSPYNILDYISIHQMRAGRVAFIITDGSAMDLRMGRISKGLRSLTGLKSHILKRASLIHDELIVAVIDEVARRLQKHVIKTRIAKGRTGSGMRYYYFLLSDAEESLADCGSHQVNTVASLV